MRGIYAQEVVVFFFQFEAMLVEANVAQAVAVIALIYRGAGTEIAGRNERRRIFGHFGFEAVVHGAAQLEVARVVIHQVPFLVAAPVYAAHADDGGIAIAAHKLVAVDIDCVVAAGIVLGAFRIKYHVVIISLPVVGFKTGQVDFVGQYLAPGFVFKCIGPTQTSLHQAAFSGFEHSRQASVKERVPRFHADDAIKSIGAVESGTGAHNQVYTVDIQLGSAEEVAQRKVKPRRLIVHPVDDLQGAHRAGAVEAAGVDDLETQTGGSEIDVF